MNSEPLSEPIRMMGKGNSAMTSSMAATTQLAALILTEWLTVQPVAMSVIVRVKQNSPVELPPSWPTRSISSKPGVASSHSDQVPIGIWCLNSVPGSVGERPLVPNAALGPRSLRSMDAGLIEQSTLASSSLRSISPSRPMRITIVGSIGPGRLPPGQRVNSPAEFEGAEHPRRVERGSRLSDFGHPDAASTEQLGPCPVAVPGRQPDDRLENRTLLGPRSSSIGGSHLVGHGPALRHRKLHRTGVARGRPKRRFLPEVTIRSTRRFLLSQRG